jgi:hypothetical protein
MAAERNSKSGHFIHSLIPIPLILRDNIGRVLVVIYAVDR